mmetsp:Transcript_1893/g.4700  ORF Transcript_1893/g.4700 Transcript_1893/m.4700 type:complete len:375 (+) Transcript_1893:352-1476(+)
MRPGGRAAHSSLRRLPILDGGATRERAADPRGALNNTRGNCVPCAPRMDRRAQAGPTAVAQLGGHLRVLQGERGVVVALQHRLLRRRRLALRQVRLGSGIHERPGLRRGVADHLGLRVGAPAPHLRPKLRECAPLGQRRRVRGAARLLVPWPRRVLERGHARTQRRAGGDVGREAEVTGHTEQRVLRVGQEVLIAQDVHSGQRRRQGGRIGGPQIEKAPEAVVPRREVLPAAVLPLARPEQAVGRGRRLAHVPKRVAWRGLRRQPGGWVAHREHHAHRLVRARLSQRLVHVRLERHRVLPQPRHAVVHHHAAQRRAQEIAHRVGARVGQPHHRQRLGRAARGPHAAGRLQRRPLRRQLALLRQWCGRLLRGGPT